MLYCFHTLKGLMLFEDIGESEIEQKATEYARQFGSDIRITKDGELIGNFYGRRVDGKFTVEGGKFFLAKGVE